MGHKELHPITQIDERVAIPRQQCIRARKLWHNAIHTVMFSQRVISQFLINHRKTTLITKLAQQPVKFGFTVRDFVPNTCILTDEIQSSLLKSRLLYSDSDVQMIERIAMCIPAFLKYPPSVRKQICQTVQYQRFGPGRLLIKQGHRPVSFYFVVNGILNVFKEENGVQVELNELTSGDCFGEKAISQKTLRNASIFTQTDVDLFEIGGSTFLDIIQHTASLELQVKIKAIQSVAFLACLPGPQLHKLAESSSVHEFQTNQVIFRERQVSNAVYLIVRGSVRMLKIVPFAVHYLLPMNKYKLGLTRIQDSSVPAVAAEHQESVVHKLLNIGQLYPSQYFGHEFLLYPNWTSCSTSIVTNEPTTVIRMIRSDLACLPPDALLTLQASERDLVVGLTGQPPVPNECGVPLKCIQQAYLSTLEWTKVRKRVKQEVLADKRAILDCKLQRLRL